MTPSKMEVNAALEKLIQCNGVLDAISAEVVVNFARSLRVSSSFQIGKTTINSKSQNCATGFSPGFGNVTVNASGTHEEKAHSIGIHKERVGYFKLWVVGKDESLSIRFQNWKEELRRDLFEEKSPVYTLQVNSGEAISLSFESYEEKWNFRFFGTVYIFSDIFRNVQAGEGSGTKEKAGIYLKTLRIVR